ncbi:MAG TPA: nucleotidyltransferase family protein [Acidobacteriota bacterium]|nr:nucleotidyltransferase family protein [Acidobacteriota bacterium]HMZ81776.1 nucleotidyltransferase family protein [Acidobacteriota bacterium]HNB69825.1 nucleotidyltransferase family protein [Acidobacteriota bacterium]HNC42683.1 nucleotidyltransferase family protein [Acidobacteriota bacterium]HND19293.1 nucleotidyltransferase family protein [Acidobacteriota bacterium]
MSDLKQIAVLILAAGASRRLGHPKQLLPIGSQNLLQHTVECALGTGVQTVLVVIGAQAEIIKPTLDACAVQVVENPTWEEGMGASIRCGIAALSHVGDFDGVIIVPCDQPFLSTQFLSTLITTFYRTRKNIIASHYADTVGIPALFTSSLFPLLLALGGDKGAKKIIQANLDQTILIPFAEGTLDIDTPADAARFLNEELSLKKKE